MLANESFSAFDQMGFRHMQRSTSSLYGSLLSTRVFTSHTVLVFELFKRLLDKETKKGKDQSTHPPHASKD